MESTPDAVDIKCPNPVPSGGSGVHPAHFALPLVLSSPSSAVKGGTTAPTTPLKLNRTEVLLLKESRLATMGAATMRRGHQILLPFQRT